MAATQRRGTGGAAVSEHERRVTAIHEAGHAVVAACLNMPTKCVSIISLSRSVGSHKLGRPARQSSQRRLAIWALSGAQAEMQLLGSRSRLVHLKAAGDYQFVRELLELTREPDQDVDELAANYELLARAFVIGNEKWIEAVAQRLLRDQVLDDDTVRDLRPA